MASKGGSGRRAQQAERRERLEQVRREQQRQERRRALLIYGACGVVLVVIIGSAALGLRSSAAGKQDVSVSGVKTYQVTPEHVTTPVTYAQSPPAGGKHNPIWLNCGTYPTQVPNENAVHSMEHGAVWVTYRPDLPANRVAALKAVVPDTYAVLSPYSGLKAPVVASAWGKQLYLDSANDPRLEGFIRKYRQGAQAPETGAACTGGSDGTLPLNTTGGMPAPSTTTQS